MIVLKKCIISRRGIKDVVNAQGHNGKDGET
jgi:hypothetical protein